MRITGSYTGTATGDGSDTLTYVENVRGCAYGDVFDVASGAKAAYLSGNGGSDSFSILGSVFWLTGGDGNDNFTVGSGAAIDYGMDGNSGNDTLNGSSGNDTLSISTYGGDPGGDTINGVGGDDTIDGRDQVSGSDTINGGDGLDSCQADPGDVILNCSP